MIGAPGRTASRRKAPRAAFIAAAGFLVAVACGTTGTSDPSTDGPSDGTGGSGGSPATGTGGAPGTGGAIGTGGAAGSTSAGGATTAVGGSSSTGGSAGAGGQMLMLDAGSDALQEGCALVEKQATRIPLTLYVMLDRSASMSDGGKWDAAKTALVGAFMDSASAGITVGLSLFPIDGLVNGQCDFTNYTDPLVPFAVLPGNAGPVMTALGNATPSGFGTPIYPALGGALTRALTQKMAKPGETFAVILFTDGEPAPEPSMCGTVNALDQATIAALADNAFTNFHVKTFVVGLPGVNQDFANLLAQKGGTDGAIVVGKNGVDVEKDFEAALAKVRGDGLGCVFPLPPDVDGKMYDYGHVNVRYTEMGTGPAHDLPRSIGCVTADAWDYDDASKPTAIVLCSGSCAAVKADPLAKVDVVLGCPTVMTK